jgi:hypothetical protein
VRSEDGVDGEVAVVAGENMVEPRSVDVEVVKGERTFERANNPLTVD